MEIRFAKPGDLKQCLTLDWSYETEYVWQMQSEDSGSRIEVTFRSMRLPRAVTVNAPPDPQHVKENWERQECFLNLWHAKELLLSQTHKAPTDAQLGNARPWNNGRLLRGSKVARGGGIAPFEHTTHAAATDLNVTAMRGCEGSDAAAAETKHVAEAA